MGLSNMTPEERNLKIFEASIGCSTAAVEFLRSVNRPINATYIAQNAWEIAKRLEEMMEVAIAKENAAAGNAARPVTPAASAPQKMPTSSPGLDLVPFNDAPPAVAAAR